MTCAIGLFLVVIIGNMFIFKVEQKNTMGYSIKEYIKKSILKEVHHLRELIEFNI